MAEISSTNPVAGFVLAGGKSRRMGRDKAALQWNHHTLLEHMVELLSTACDPVGVVGKQDLPDKIPGRGPLGGILTALDVTTTAMSLIVAVDLPLLTPEFLRWFCSRLAASSKPILACQTGGDFPLCLGVHRSAQSEIVRRIEANDLALHRFILGSGAEILSETEVETAGFHESIFHNANTPEDWRLLGR